MEWAPKFRANAKENIFLEKIDHRWSWFPNWRVGLPKPSCLAGQTCCSDQLVSKIRYERETKIISATRRTKFVSGRCQKQLNGFSARREHHRSVRGRRYISNVLAINGSGVSGRLPTPPGAHLASSELSQLGHTAQFFLFRAASLSHNLTTDDQWPSR